jgi:transposase-like protein
VGQRQSYTSEFKDAIRAKILNRGSRTITEICEEAGVGVSAASNWLKPHGSSLGMKKHKSSSKRTPEQKMKILIETSQLTESELGAYVRKEGLFDTELAEWRSEFISLMTASRTRGVIKDGRDKKIKDLERELLRKDKALAEASALLILQKKVNLIWGNKDEEDE